MGENLNRFLWICLGSGFGGGCRYLLSQWLPRVAGTTFPWATLSVNVVGSFLLAMLMHMGVTAGLLSPTLRIALTTGVMGGFTTYSTFNFETLQYLNSGAWALGALNITATVLGCGFAGYLGTVVGRVLTGW